MNQKMFLKASNARYESLIKIHAAVFLFGAAGLFGKLLSLPSVIIVLGRAFFAAILLLILSIGKKRLVRLVKKKDYGHMAILGMILAFHWSAFYYSIQLSTVAVGLLTFSTFPVFVTFLEPYFFKQKARLVDFVLAFTCLFGVFLIVPELRVTNDMFKGVLWGIASGLSFAILSILNKKHVKRYSSLIIAFYQNITAAILLVPFLFLLKPNFEVKDIFLLALLGIIFTGLSHSLFISSLGSIRAHTASIITTLEPVYGIVFAALLLGEMPTLKVLIGGTVIIGSALYSSIKSRKEC